MNMSDNQAKQKLIVLAAGGSGGHIFPAEAVAEVLIAHGIRVILITDSRFANFKTGALSQIETRTIHTGTTAGSLPKKIAGVIGLGIGIIQAFLLLRRLKPNIVVGFGGYPSFPTLFAASRSGGGRTLIHEQNSVLGRANRLLVKRIDIIATSFPKTLMIPEKCKAHIDVVGNPVRASIKAISHLPYCPILPDGKVNILVTGGSQGASIFSQIVPQAIALLPDNLRSRIRINQQCREADAEATKAAYAQINVNADIASFFVDMPARLAMAHLVIARSGASTIFELAVAGRPAILVPLPTSMDNHQYHNAAAFEAVGGGWVVKQEDFTAAALATRLEEFIATPETIAKAAENAKKFGDSETTTNLVDIIIKHANNNYLYYYYS